MADDLTADDLRALSGLWNEASACRGYPGIEERADRAADLMDQGWRLTPPPQPGTVTANADDLQKVLWPYTDRELRAAQARLAVALAEADRGR